MNITIGIDEAGRGPWAGPVAVGLVILNSEQENYLVSRGINDSKKLTEKKREAFVPLILEHSLYAKVKFLHAIDIDKLGIYESTIYLIKEMAKDPVLHKFQDNEEKLLICIDGVFPNLELLDIHNKIIPHECIIKGDEKVPAISAASILAKVRRDAYMKKLKEKYPQYQFEKHKGYGTKLHSEMLKNYGICDEHRKSFKPIQNYC